MRTTSIEVYERIKADGLLSEAQWAVYDVVFTNGPVTQNEAHRLLAGTKGFENKPTVTPRFAELERKGVVAIVGKRICSVSKRPCLAYDVTAAMPDNRPRKVRPCEIIQKQKREIDRLRLELAAARAKLAKWGRPTNEERMFRKVPQAFCELFPALS